ncbi:hypothetical protein FEO84_21585 [Stenotrophomonas maltophilia]|nr:hypothetical protein FEO84_21585 [Stenotrophomonas maltophilia]
MVEPCREAGSGYVRTGALARPTAGVGLFAGLRPAPAEATAEARATATATAGIPWFGGAVSECGDAVNPSLEAWQPHPCG